MYTNIQILKIRAFYDCKTEMDGGDGLDGSDFIIKSEGSHTIQLSDDASSRGVIAKIGDTVKSSLRAIYQSLS